VDEAHHPLHLLQSPARYFFRREILVDMDEGIPPAHGDRPPDIVDAEPRLFPLEYAGDDILLDEDLVVQEILPGRHDLRERSRPKEHAYPPASMRGLNNERDSNRIELQYLLGGVLLIDGENNCIGNMDPVIQEFDMHGRFVDRFLHIGGMVDEEGLIVGEAVRERKKIDVGVGGPVEEHGEGEIVGEDLLCDRIAAGGSDDAGADAAVRALPGEEGDEIFIMLPLPGDSEIYLRSHSEFPLRSTGSRPDILRMQQRV